MFLVTYFFWQIAKFKSWKIWSVPCSRNYVPAKTSSKVVECEGHYHQSFAFTSLNVFVFVLCYELRLTCSQLCSCFFCHCIRLSFANYVFCVNNSLLYCVVPYGIPQTASNLVCCSKSGSSSLKTRI